MADSRTKGPADYTVGPALPDQIDPGEGVWQHASAPRRVFATMIDLGTMFLLGLWIGGSESLGISWLMIAWLLNSVLLQGWTGRSAGRLLTGTRMTQVLEWLDKNNPVVGKSIRPPGAVRAAIASLPLFLTLWLIVIMPFAMCLVLPILLLVTLISAKAETAPFERWGNVAIVQYEKYRTPREQVVILKDDD